MLFLQALLANRKEKDLDRHLDLLRDVLDAHERERSDAPASGVFQEYIQYNPDFMVEVAKEVSAARHEAPSCEGNASSGHNLTRRFAPPSSSSTFILQPPS